MELFPTITIIIVVLIIIILIIVAVAVAVSQGGGSNNNNSCMNQNECPIGYVCIISGSGITGTCKAGIGTSCNTDSDCIDGLICPSTTKVCTRNPVSENVSFSSLTKQITLATNNKNIDPESIIAPNPTFVFESIIVPNPTFVPESITIPNATFVPESIIVPEPVFVPKNIMIHEPIINISRNDETVSYTQPTDEIIVNNSTVDFPGYIDETLANILSKEELVPTPILNLPTISSLHSEKVNLQVGSPVLSFDNVRMPTRRIVTRKGGNSATPISDGVKFDTVKPIVQTPIVQKSNIKRVDDAMVRGIIIKRKPIFQNETSSFDDEENSTGNYKDAPFDVRSADTTDSKYKNYRNEYPVTSVSSPCEEKDGVYYCRSNKAEQTINNTIDRSPVIDVCSYSNATLFLLENGNIICEIEADNPDEKSRYRTSNNIHLLRITSFKGYLYGMGVDHKLYTLPNSYFPTMNWLWNCVAWAPIDIKHISSTHDGSHLWIQTNSTGLLYNSPDVKQSLDWISYHKRIYGRDVDHYIDINQSNFTAKIYPQNKTINNIYDGALSYYHEVIVIHPSESDKYRSITIVNWKPYYIRA